MIHKIHFSIGTPYQIFQKVKVQIELVVNNFENPELLIWYKERLSLETAIINIYLSLASYKLRYIKK